MSLMGVEWRLPGQVLSREPRTVTLLLADVQAPRSMQIAVANRDGQAAPTGGSTTCAIDPPWGWGCHEATREENSHKVVTCDKPWDTPDQAWGADNMEKAVRGSVESGLLRKRHCLIVWTPMAKVDDFSSRLVQMEYSKPQVVTWVKNDSSR
jgi:hypothetical protein